jgi:hypothetical protein
MVVVGCVNKTHRGIRAAWTGASWRAQGQRIRASSKTRRTLRVIMILIVILIIFRLLSAPRVFWEGDFTGVDSLAIVH